MEVRWAHRDEELRGCHVAFISRSESKHYAKILQVLKDENALTVGETPDFLDAGGTVTFSFQGDSLQFEVSLAAANNSHLEISCYLLSRARRVRNGVQAAKS
jgi:hypothetical protein